MSLHLGEPLTENDDVKWHVVYHYWMSGHYLFRIIILQLYNLLFYMDTNDGYHFVLTVTLLLPTYYSIV